MNAVAGSRSPTRWVIYVALWLLLSCVFASQLFLSGYVTPWSRAFASESVYWLSWGAMLPAVFGWCRRLREREFSTRVAGLVAGAVIALVLEPLVYQAIVAGQASAQLCFGECELGPRPFSAAWFMRAVRAAGVNLPVYAGFVLAWYAATFYREMRDRQLRAAELESLLHQAQLEALRSQLNPHFLFNTLHSIAELVHSNPKLAEQLIVRLGELLRQVLQTSTRQELTLAEELEFIRGYVEIEQMRLGERLHVIWEIQPEALELRVPGLILQPLVENAIQHGIASCAGPGTLTIRAQRAGDQLRIEIADTGVGLSPADSGRPRGIGLANTQARLQRLYGERQSFELRNGEGLVVSLRLPAQGP
jgi:signal transduction histidine kinase